MYKRQAIAEEWNETKEPTPQAPSPQQRHNANSCVHGNASGATHRKHIVYQQAPWVSYQTRPKSRGSIAKVHPAYILCSLLDARGFFDDGASLSSNAILEQLQLFLESGL